MKKHIKKHFIVTVLLVAITSCSNQTTLPSTLTSSHTHISSQTVQENRIEPTCTNEGSYELVTYCIEDNTELSRERYTIPALDHDLVHHSGKAPTCVENGYMPYDTCTRCDYSTYVGIMATGHFPGATVTENIVEATCTEPGSYDLVVYCERDGVELSRRHQVIPALGHALVHHSGKDPTCVENGYMPYDTCSRCDYSTYEIMAPLGHTEGVTVEENRIEPTCTKDGSYDLVTYCSVDNVEMYRETFSIPATGHLNSTKLRKNIIEPTCTEYGSYDYIEYCDECGEKIGEEHILTEPLSHHLIHHHGKESTCIEQGYNDYYECDRCEYSTKHLNGLLQHVEGQQFVDNMVAPNEDNPGSFELVTLCSVGGEELSRRRYQIGNSEHIILTNNNASIFEQEYYRFYLDSSSDINDVTWSVSNEDILSVNSNGKLASYGAGESIVFATSESGEFASAYIEVKEDRIDISAPSNSYFPGDSFSMIVSENSRGDDNRITWSSSDENVATVSSGGLVNVLTSGSVTIRAELPSGVYDECLITFGNHYLNLKSSSHSMYKNDTYTLLSGCSAPSSIRWTSSNTSVATVSSSGVVTAKTTGSTTITASSDLCGTKTCVITVTTQTVTLTSSNYSSYYSVSCSFQKKTTTGWLGGTIISYWATVTIRRTSGTWIATSDSYIELNFYQTGDPWGSDYNNSSQTHKFYLGSVNPSLTYSQVELYLVSTSYKANWRVSSVHGTISR